MTERDQEDQPAGDFLLVCAGLIAGSAVTLLAAVTVAILVFSLGVP